MNGHSPETQGGRPAAGTSGRKVFLPSIRRRAYTSTREILGMCAALCFAALWAIASSLSRVMPVPSQPVTVRAFLAVFIAFVILAPLTFFFRAKRISTGAVLRALIIGAILHGVVPLCYYLSQFSITEPQIVMVFAGAPLLTIFFAYWAGSETVTWAKIAGVLVILVGLFMTFLDNPLLWRPSTSAGSYFLVLGIAFSHALYAAKARPLIRQTHVVVFTVLTLAGGSVLLFTLSIVTGELPQVFTISGEVWLRIVLNSFLYFAPAFCLYNYALTRTSPIRVVATTSLSTILAEILGVLFLNDPLHWGDFIGIMLTLVGMRLVYARTLGAARRRKSSPARSVSGGSEAA